MVNKWRLGFQSLLAVVLVLSLTACQTTKVDKNASLNANASNNSQATNNTASEQTSLAETTSTQPTLDPDDNVLRIAGDVGVNLLSSRAGLRGIQFLTPTIAEHLPNGETVINPNFADIEIKQLADDATKVEVTYKLKPNLKWSDGEDLTAKDFLGAALVYFGPHSDDLYLFPTTLRYMRDLDDYKQGKSEILKTFSLIDDHTFKVKIAAEVEEAYPDMVDQQGDFYRQIAWTEALDLPILPWHKVFSDLDLVATKDGVKFSNKLDTAELKKRLTDDKNAYLLHFDPTLAPYYVKEKKENEATLLINPYYPGNYDGSKPSIAKLIVKNIDLSKVTTEADVKELFKQVDFVNFVTNPEIIKSYMSQAEQHKLNFNGNLSEAAYQMLYFKCKDGITADPLVRKAIAYSIDSPALSKQALGYSVDTSMPFAENGAEYRLGGAKLVKDLSPYHYDLNKATELLEQAGWNKNAEGKTFAAGTDKVRYKEVNGKLQELKLTLYPFGINEEYMNAISKGLTAALAQVGCTVEELPIGGDNDDANYKNADLRVGLGENQNIWLRYNIDPQQGPIGNVENGWQNERAKEAAIANREAKTWDDYLKSWSDYFHVWHEDEPAHVLWPMNYYDFYKPQLANYQAISSENFFKRLSHAYLSAKIAD